MPVRSRLNEAVALGREISYLFLSWKSLMQHVLCHSESDRRGARGSLVLGLLLLAATAAGCGHEAKISFANNEKPPTFQVIQPSVRDIVRIVGQPSFIESYERTSIYAKPTAYIDKWIVDIGDKVKKNDVLAKLFAPELVEEYQTKKAAVALDVERIAFAKQQVKVATADVTAAAASVKESEAILGKYQSEVDRWDAEVKKLESQVASVVIDRRVLFESTNQLKSSAAARDKAVASIKKAKADLLLAQATLAKTEVEVRVTEAALIVAKTEEQYAKAWVDYLTLTAPFDGVITVRNANTFDFVLPTTGDPTAFYLSPDISPGATAAPIFVVDRIDIVRIFIDVPEQDALYVHPGGKATVVSKAYRDEPIPGTVTRIAWALNMKSRTLRVEVDLKNPGSQLLPGVYAYVNLMIERPKVRALPEAAISYGADTAYYWTRQNGKAVRTEVRTGVSDGEWVEVTNRHALSFEAEYDAEHPWVPIDGTEEVILGDLSQLTDGATVAVAPATEGTKP